MNEQLPTPVTPKTPAQSAGLDADLAARTLGEVIESVRSEAISPGAGAAGAVALALGAACAGKAVAVTLKRRPEDAALLRARERLAQIGHRALRGAEDDANRFEDFVRSKDADAAERLIDTGEWLRRLAEELMEGLREIEGLIDPVVASDVMAARTLASAFDAIQSVNLEENRRAADEVK